MQGTGWWEYLQAVPTAPTEFRLSSAVPQMVCLRSHHGHDCSIGNAAATLRFGTKSIFSDSYRNTPEFVFSCRRIHQMLCPCVEESYVYAAIRKIAVLPRKRVRPRIRHIIRTKAVTGDSLSKWRIGAIEYIERNDYYGNSLLCQQLHPHGKSSVSL